MEEQYDILDEHGEPTGEILPKSVVHDRELWHASSFVWIYNKHGEVLLQKRSPDKKSFPDVWDVSVAGHISAGDSPEITAVREIEEEIGLQIRADELIPIIKTHDIVPWLPNKKHPEFCWVFILYKEIELDQLNMQQSELTDLKLMRIEEIERTRHQPGHELIFANRTNDIYEPAFMEIKRRLQEYE